MSIPSLFSRLRAYYSRHGFVATVRRFALAGRRALRANRTVLFYCDLSAMTAASSGIDQSWKLERKRGVHELSPDIQRRIASVWSPKLARRRMQERFGRGAWLWLIQSGGRLAGYGWTLRGDTIEPHYVALGAEDTHLFDFHVFPEFRGRGINPFLVREILSRLAAQGGGRAFIEAAEWNQSQISSLQKTPFRRLGLARKLTVFGRTIVCWTAGGSASGVRGNPARPPMEPEKRVSPDLPWPTAARRGE